MSVMKKLLEINDELVRTFAELEQLRSDQKTLQEICTIGRNRITELQAERDEAVEHAGRLQAELDATRKQLQELCTRPAEPQPVQVCEGRWRMRNGEIRDVIPTPDDDERATRYPWYDAKYDQTWQNNGRYYLGEENQRDLVEYLGPIEPQPVQEVILSAYIVGDKVSPEALRIVWATEEWIQQSQFGIVHPMKDVMFLDQDRFTPEQFSLTLYLKK